MRKRAADAALLGKYFWFYFYFIELAEIKCMAGADLCLVE
jgi:hypothetical protein